MKYSKMTKLKKVVAGYNRILGRIEFRIIIKERTREKDYGVHIYHSASNSKRYAKPSNFIPGISIFLEKLKEAGRFNWYISQDTVKGKTIPIIRLY